MKIPNHFLPPSGFYFRSTFDFVCVVCLVHGHFACFLVTGRFPGTKLYAEFWDVLKPGGIPIGFEKILGFLSCHRFGRRSSR